MTEVEIQERIQEVMEAYSELKELDRFDLSIEAIDLSGDVNVTLTCGRHKVERKIGIAEPLGFISDTFRYGEYLTPTTCDLSLNRLKMAYFDELGRLAVVRDGYSTSSAETPTEYFKIHKHQRERMKALLKEKLGDKFKT